MGPRPILGECSKVSRRKISDVDWSPWLSFWPPTSLELPYGSSSIRDINTEKAYYSRKPVYVLQMKEQKRVEFNKQRLTKTSAQQFANQR